VKFQCYYPYFTEIPPTITDGEGKPFVIEKVKTFGLPVLDNVELAAGKEIQLAELQFSLKPAPEKGVAERNLPGTLKGTGKFQIHYGQLAYEGDLGRIATGKLELEVLDKQPMAEKMPVKVQKFKQEKDAVKEVFTAWGKEVGGLQAGLGFPPGDKRIYSPGETVTLVVRARNVGKEAVKFQYLYKYFIRTPPTMTDGEGKTVPQAGVTPYGFNVPQNVDLAPGKEIDLYELKFKLRPASELTDETRNYPGQLWGEGKFRVQYERLASADIDPILSKLATGKLELEIQSEPPPATEKK